MYLRVLIFCSIVFCKGVSAMEYATVVSVVSINETREIPTQVCNEVSVPIYGRGPSAGGVIGKAVDVTFGSTEGLVGAITGGFIGSKIGGGSGRKIATAAGVAIGAKVGDGRVHDKLQVVGYEKQQKCHEVSITETVTSGYHVIYDYQGMTLSKAMKYPPVIGSKHAVSIEIH
jgi:uncharacterized protein YcfJ